MEVIDTDIQDIKILKPRLFKDERGCFFESFSQKEFNEKVSEVYFVQDNESESKYGVIRGLHYQRPPFSQSKLVRVIKGAVLDVVVDIREYSPTFGKYVSALLDENNKHQLFIPEGFAHGFSVLSDTAVFQYKCDKYYHPDSECAIAWNDSDLNINWLIPYHKVIISEKDSKNPLLRNILKNQNL